MRSFTSSVFSALTAIALCAPASSLLAQQVISARSGVVQYVEGHVTAGSEILNPKTGEFPSLKKDQVLRTEEGRTEILLTPGAFLRVGENSSVRMVSTSLSDTQVEFLEGSALVECDDLLKDNAVTILHGGTKVSLLKNGLYRFDGRPARVGVYSGEAQVSSSGGKTLVLKGGHQAPLEGLLAASSFDNKLEEDALYRWSARRSNYLAMANLSAAKAVQDSGSYWGSNIWAFNPYFGTYTFVPYDGILYSPFGYGFYSPFAAYNYYNLFPGYYPGNYYYPSSSGGGGGSGSKGGKTPYTPRQLGYTAGSRGSGVGAVSRGSAATGSAGRTGGGGGRSSGGALSGWSGGSSGYSGSSAAAAPAPSGGGHSSGGGHGH
jgi:hypothetical protein